MAQGYQNKINKENTNGKQERKKRKKGIGERAGCVCSCIPFWVGFIDVDASFLEKNLLSFRTCFLIWRDFLLRTQVRLHT